MFSRVHRVVAATCLIVSARLVGQASPNYGFAVVPVLAEFRGDSLQVGYRLVNPKENVESVGLFNVPYKLAAVQALTPDSNWMVMSGGRRIKSVEWGALDTTVQNPGDTSPVLVYRGVGVVGIVTAWFSPFRSTPTEEAVLAAEAARCS